MFIATLTERLINHQMTCMEVENGFAKASISLLGGQVLSYVPKADGRERLFMSPAARLDGSKSIRGGIPVCWPWFGAHKDAGHPAHGFVRTRQWHVVEDSQGCPSTRILLAPADTAGPGFAGSASLLLEILVGEVLTLNLHTTNTGSVAFPLSAALHTYFAVQDVQQCTLDGLAGTYSDKTRAWAMLETPAPYRFTEETDRIHLQAATELSIVERSAITRIGSAGHDSIVVWNPWAENSRQLPDMGDEVYRNMLCVETAVTQGLQLQPGASHTLTQTIF